VVETLCISTNVPISGNETCSYQGGPSGLEWDSANGDVYVADQGASNLTVISAASNSVIANVNVGPFAIAVACDPITNELYVAVEGLNAVAVVSGAANTVVTDIPVGEGPVAVAFDPDNGNVYVANSDTDNVSVIDGSTLQVISNIPVHGSPEAIAFSGSSGDLYVTGSALSVIDGANNSVVATVPVGGSSQGVAFDPTNGDIYVPQVQNDTLAVINGSTNSLEAWIDIHTTGNQGDDPVAVGVDTANGDVLVANFFSDDVDVVPGTMNVALNPIEVGKEAWGVTYDGATGLAYVSNFGAGTVSILRPPATYAVTFTEAGLPSGTPWTVGAYDIPNGTEYPVAVGRASSGTQITTYGPNGTLDFQISTTAAFSPSPARGSVMIVGGPRAVNVNFSVTAPVPGPSLGPNGAWIALGAGPVILGAVVAAVFVLRHRRFRT